MSIIHPVLRPSLSDVIEPNADPTGQTIAGQLIVDSTHSYADLDELIVNHVQAMARRVEELMAHERFKHGSEDDLRKFELSETHRIRRSLLCRSHVEKFPGRKSRKEHVWIYPESQEAGSFQPLLFGE